MALAKIVRDQLLVEAKHRCTICSEKCFEVHHIIEQADGGSDDPDNLIVLCPNCHQHRYHRSKEFSRDQLYLYKAKLKEQNEIEKRLLLNLEEIRAKIGEIPLAESEQQIRQELQESVRLVSQERSPIIYTEVAETSRWLAERELIRGGARKAIEIDWEIRERRALNEWRVISLVEIDHDAWEKASDFERAYKLVFIFDREPDSKWCDVFTHVHDSSFYLMKRRTYLQRDRLVMIVADSDDLQQHANYAKQLVQDTNGYIQNQILPRIERSIESQKQQALEQFDTVQALKAKTKEIKL